MSDEKSPAADLQTPREAVTLLNARLHDQHCVWCDTEEFMAMRYGSLHHLSERAVMAIQAANREPRCAAGCVSCADDAMGDSQ